VLHRPCEYIFSRPKVQPNAPTRSNQNTGLSRTHIPGETSKREFPDGCRLSHPVWMLAFFQMAGTSSTGITGNELNTHVLIRKCPFASIRWRIDYTNDFVFLQGFETTLELVSRGLC